MPSRSKQLAICGGIALLTICALSINVALPMTVRVVDDKTSHPIEGAFVVSYLAIRHLPHNFDDGKSVIQEAVTDANGDAKFKLSVSWIFVNGFQDYSSKLLVFKSGIDPNSTDSPFHIIRIFTSFASLKTNEIRVSRSTEDIVDRKNRLGSLAGVLVQICLKVPTDCSEKYIPQFLSAFETARAQEFK
jgi:hypothetical protein